MTTIIPFPTPRRASSFDAILAAMDATGEPNGRIVANDARLVEQMEEEGVVTRANHVGKREILVEER